MLKTWNFPAIVVGAPETVPWAASAMVLGADFEILRKLDFKFYFLKVRSVQFVNL
jgi:hypothetical protein